MSWKDTSTIDVCTDIPEWWKQNARAYPCLARITGDYLAIPATSAPAERVFSRGADLIAKKRGSLSEDAHPSLHVSVWVVGFDLGSCYGCIWIPVDGW